MHRSDRTTQVSRTLLVVLGLVGLFSTGCAARVYSRGYVAYSAPVVFVEAPELVYVEPGVYVVRNYDDAVYYSDGYYWCNRGGVWYHTAYWNDPWVTVSVNVVPSIFVHRDHRTYVHYHGAPGATVYRQPARTYHTASASAHVGAHASAGAGSYQPPQPPPAPGGASGSIHVGGQVSHHRPTPPQPAPPPRAHGSASDQMDARVARNQPVQHSSPRGSAHSQNSSPSRASAPSPQPRASSAPSPQPRAASAPSPQPRASSAPAPSRSTADKPKKSASRSKKKSER